MSFTMIAQRGRTSVYNGSLYQADGVTPTQLAASDKLRVKICSTDDGTPELDLVSGTPTVNGSNVAITDRGSATGPAKYSVTVGQDDAALLTVRTYNVELFVVDSQISQPSNAAKPVELGVLCVLAGVGGAVS